MLCKPCNKCSKGIIFVANKGPSSQSYGFSSSHVWLRELAHKEGWALKNWCFWAVVLEKTLESCLNCEEVKPVNPKGNQLWIFFGRTDAEAETPIFWSPDPKSRLLEKILMLGKIWGRRTGHREWDDWMVSPTQRTGIWANCGRQWGTQKPGVPQPMGSQRVGHDLATEQ